MYMAVKSYFQLLDTGIESNKFTLEIILSSAEIQKYCMT